MTASAGCEIELSEDLRFEPLGLLQNLAVQLAGQGLGLNALVFLSDAGFDREIELERAHSLHEQVACAAFVARAVGLRDRSQQLLQPDLKAAHLAGMSELSFIQLDHHLDPGFPAPLLDVKDAADARGMPRDRLRSVEEADPIGRQLWGRHR